MSPFKSKNLFAIFHTTKIHRESNFLLLDKTILDVYLSKIPDPFMFFSCCTLTWSKDKNTNNWSAFTSVLFPEAKFPLKFLETSDFIDFWAGGFFSCCTTVLFGWMQKSWMWMYCRVMGFGCSEICFKIGRYSLVVKVGNYLELF